jgi:hypothetical protein
MRRLYVKYRILRSKKVKQKSFSLNYSCRDDTTSFAWSKLSRIAAGCSLVSTRETSMVGYGNRLRVLAESNHILYSLQYVFN